VHFNGLRSHKSKFLTITYLLSVGSLDAVLESLDGLELSPWTVFLLSRCHVLASEEISGGLVQENRTALAIFTIASN